LQFCQRANNQPDFYQPAPSLLSLEAALLNGILGARTQPYFKCPKTATDCSWDPFTTLGVCVDFKNVTNQLSTLCDCPLNSDDRLTFDCFERPKNGTTDNLHIACHYSFPDLPDGRLLPVSMEYVFRFDSQTHKIEEHVWSTMFRSQATITDGIGGATFLKRVGPLPQGLQKAPEIEAYFAQWYWCAQTFHNVTASAEGVGTVGFTSEKLADLDDISIVHLTSPSGKNFTVDRQTRLNLVSFLARQLNTTVRMGQGSLVDSQETLDFGSFFLASNLTDATRNIATTLSNMIRDKNGDNPNATFVKGTARMPETYVKVRWGWLLIPLIEATLATILLITTIILTRNTALLKTSLITLLVHGIDGLSPQERYNFEADSAERLEKASEHVLVTFQQENRSRFGFVKTQSGIA